VARTAHPKMRTEVLTAYRKASGPRSAFELSVTATSLTALWIADWLLYAHGYWWASLLIAIPAAGFLVRLFMIQHDCGHGAFFPNRLLND
jgi:acyl-lipid omega-6 desaturase (Delta-12 desaturase)